MRAYVLALFFLTIPFIAKAQQFDGYQAFEILTQAERRFFRRFRQLFQA